MVAKTLSFCCARLMPQPDSFGSNQRSEASNEYGVSASAAVPVARARRQAMTRRQRRMKDATRRRSAGSADGPDGLVDVHEAQVEDVGRAQLRLHVLAHGPRHVAVDKWDERRVGIENRHGLVEERIALRGVELDASL